MSTDLQALVKGVLVDLDGSGALADALQEAGRDREAELLRKRWERWQRERARAVESDAEYTLQVERIARSWQADTDRPMKAMKAFTHKADQLDRVFRRYVLHRFGERA